MSETICRIDSVATAIDFAQARFLSKAGNWPPKRPQISVASWLMVRAWNAICRLEPLKAVGLFPVSE